MTPVKHGDRSGEHGNMRRVAHPWWELDHGERIGVYFGITNGRTMTTTQLGAKLSDQAKRMLIAVHEAGHVAAVHGLGLGLGTAELLTDAPEELGSGTLIRLGKSGYAEQEPRTGQEMATVALAGWAAAQLWLKDRGLMDEYTSWYVQLGVIDDHHWLLNIPTTEPTAYLYGRATAPDRWNGQYLSVDAVLQQTIRLVHSRWIDVLKLSRELRRDRMLSPQTTSTVLGDPGWARPSGI